MLKMLFFNDLLLQWHRRSMGRRGPPWVKPSRGYGPCCKFEWGGSGMSRVIIIALSDAFGRLWQDLGTDLGVAMDVAAPGELTSLPGDAVLAILRAQEVMWAVRSAHRQWRTLAESDTPQRRVLPEKEFERLQPAERKQAAVCLFGHSRGGTACHACICSRRTSGPWCRCGHRNGRGRAGGPCPAPS